MALQRDTYYHGNWTNHEGYSDGTAGAALNNIMRQQRATSPPRARREAKGDDGTQFISVPHKAPKTATVAKPKVEPPKAKPKAEPELKTARSVFTILQSVCALQGLAIQDITLQDKTTKQEWVKADLMAPPKK